MTDEKEPFQAQATRSFGDYVQGAWYSIDPRDGQLMSLLGAGYFDTVGNDNLTRERFTYEAGEVVAPANVGTRDGMGEQQHVNVEEGYQPANTVEVPEKMTGEQRATTADKEQADGEVGTESRGDSTRGKRSGAKARQSGDTRDN
jgi:hypothetical protein